MEEKQLNENLEITNKLLLDMVQNQRGANNNLTKIIISVSVCFCTIIVAMIIGFFVYESQFETKDIVTEETITQESNTDGGGTAIVNNGGDVNYGTSKTNN